MTPKEKAKELVDKCTWKCRECDYEETAKYCANVVVDEIIKTSPIYPNDVDWDDAGGTHEHYHYAQRNEALNYWQQVKKEITNL